MSPEEYAPQKTAHETCHSVRHPQGSKGIPTDSARERPCAIHTEKCPHSLCSLDYYGLSTPYLHFRHDSLQQEESGHESSLVTFARSGHDPGTFKRPLPLKHFHLTQGLATYVDRPYRARSITTLNASGPGSRPRRYVLNARLTPTRNSTIRNLYGIFPR